MEDEMGRQPNRFKQQFKTLASFVTLPVFAVVLSLFVNLCSLSVMPAHAADAVVSAAKIEFNAKTTRFIADMDRAVAYNVYVLKSPYRVVLDLRGVSFKMRKGGNGLGKGLIKTYRYGKIDAKRSRIVMETTAPVLISKSLAIKPGANRSAKLVIDLIATDAKTFAAMLSKDEMTSLSAVAAAEQVTKEKQAALTPQQIPAALPLPRAKPSLIPNKRKPVIKPKNMRKVIVIDAGHGGIDPGASGADGAREKNIVLAFSKVLRDRLKATGRYKVVMTREDDTFLSLRQRVTVARENNADLFIAIHADALRTANARGATVYTLSEKGSDAEADALAHNENRSDIIGGVNLSEENEEITGILIELAMRETKNHSIYFAKHAVRNLKTVTKLTGRPMRSAGFRVLKAPDVPSVLIELGYLSSPQDERLLQNNAWRKKVSDALVKAVYGYFKTDLAAGN